MGWEGVDETEGWKKIQQRQINAVMHKHEISWVDGGEINGQGVINIYPICRPCLAPPTSSWHQAKTIPIKAASQHGISLVFQSEDTRCRVLKYVAKLNCGALTTVREAKWNFLLSFATFTLPPSLPFPIPLWADRHIWSSCNRISWWLVTLATISQQLHVLCFSIVPLAAASLEWIYALICTMRVKS